MNRNIQSMVWSVIGLGLITLQFVQAQSVEYGPGRGPDDNYTVVGFYTSSPPVIDGVIDDVCWTKVTAAPTAVSGGAGYDGTAFPVNQSIKMPINVDDGGTPPTSTPPPNGYTGTYPASAGSFGISWDLNYLYFAVRIVSQAAADLTDVSHVRGIEFFFNNGNGRSGIGDDITDNYPPKYNNLRDLQVQLWYLPKPGDTDFPLLNSANGLASHGISMSPGVYKFAVKKTSDGYIYEGRIAWTALNKEFINEADGTYTDNKWKPAKGRLMGIDIGASLLRDDGNQPKFQMNWNECCFNVNWTKSKYFGYLQLAGDTLPVVCPTSFNASLTSSIISTANQKVTINAYDFLPIDAAREMNWTLDGTSGGNPLALIDINTGIISPLNNGILTITGMSKIARCASGGVKKSIELIINNQESPDNIIITGTDITTNWGSSAMTASADPATAPADVVWSIDPASNLAIINSITGVIQATALGSGPVTVKAISVANGKVGTKIVNITTPVIIDRCIGINAYQYVYQCNRTINALTISGFKIGTKVRLVAQYYDPTNPSTTTVPGIPDELMKYTVQLRPNVPAASVAQSPTWDLTLNQQQGTFSITGMYLNDTTVKVQVSITLKGTTTLSGCYATTSGVNYFSMSKPNACITGIINNDLIEAATFDVFPNPANDDVNVGVTLNSGGSLSVALVNTLGEVVASSVTSQAAGRAIIKLSTASLSPGLYIVKVNASGGGTLAKKLLVSK